MPRCSGRASRSWTLLGNPTLAFLASGIEGIKVRITAKAADDAAAEAILAAEEASLRTLLGDYVFGADEQTMELVVLDLLRARGLSLAVAESVTGGLVGARLTAIAGASDVLRGGSSLMRATSSSSCWACPRGRSCASEAAAAMAAGVRKLLEADVGLATTGVAGPNEQEGQPVGTVYLGLALGDQIEFDGRTAARGPQPNPPVRRDQPAELSAPAPARPAHRLISALPPKRRLGQALRHPVERLRRAGSGANVRPEPVA